ncbi:hypothetical protein MMC31_004972 [Peltigera leucophlebia]|nr:hypothetical protein [Peltigera leucophlebia]
MMSSSNKGSGDQLKTALDKFEAVLTPEQKNHLLSIAAVPDATAIIAFTTQLDNENAKRHSRCVATRLLSFLKSIQQFTTVVDTFVSSNPAIPALVWGSVKLAVLLTSNYASYFDKLSTLFMSFSKHCPRYSEYQILYADSVGLRTAVEEPRAFWRPFKTDELGQFEKAIRECKSEVDAEIYRALHQTIFQEQQLQLIDRKAAAQHRALGSIFRARVDKSDEEERRRRILKDERQARSRKQELLERLSDYDYMTPFRRASMKRHGQTAGWLSESIEFANWTADPKSSIFILSGKLGSGKTVTTACTVGQLFNKSGNDYRVAYFFCQFDNAELLSASKILSALVRQLLDPKTLPKSIETCLVTLLKVPSPEAQDLGILLKDVLGIHKCNFIFIDAIDECARSEWEVLLEVLQNIVVSCSSRVKLFLAVRQGIAEEVGKTFVSHYQANMGSCEANSDIKTYIEDVLAKKIDGGKLIVRNPELISEIIDALVQGANGMFLWVVFQIEDICRQVCDRDIRETTRKLPKNLPETYNRILSRIAEMGNAKLAKRIFPWVATARRPMLLEELREAIAVETLQPYSDPERLVNDMSQIMSWCGNLIVLDEQDGTVQFTHQTVKIFLLESFRDQANADFHFEQQEINHYAGEICVTYLNFNDFKRKLIRQPKRLSLPTPEAILGATLSVEPSSTSTSVWKKVARLREYRRGYNPNPTYFFTGAALQDDKAVRELQTEHPFVFYAAKFWLHHSANFERARTQTWRLWEGLLFFEEGPATIPWEYSDWSQRTRTISRWICNQEHVALLSVIESSENPFAETEIRCILDFAIERPSLTLFDSVLRECHNLTRVLDGSLIVAVGRGNLWATNRLLAEKANPNWRALKLAYEEHGSQNLERLTTNVDINAQSKKYVGFTALQVAAKGGYLELVNKLIIAKADVNARAAGDFGRTALQAAAEMGHYEILTAKADVNARAALNSGRTAIQAAAENGHLEVVGRLLKANANVNATAAENFGRTALQGASEKGHLEVVERLLIAKANVNARAAHISGRTALQAASGNGHLEIVERLLIEKADVDPEAADAFGQTALQAAAENGHLEVVERLLTAKADAAAENRHLEVVERLLRAKADVNARAADSSGRTALQAAAEKGHLEIVEWLLTAKANVNAGAGKYDGRTSLQAAAGAGNLKVIERLLIAKADVNARAADYSGRTALQAAAENGHLEVVERLLKVNADVNAVAAKYFGLTALQAAAESGHLEVVERLLKLNADVNARAADYSGRTALQAAAENGHLEVVERLLKANADVNAVAAKSFGLTALQAAAEAGHFEVVERLLTAKVAEAGVRTALQTAGRNVDERIINLLKSAVHKS